MEKNGATKSAVIKCGADLILTFNLDDFQDHALASCELSVCHPDLFLVSQRNLACRTGLHCTAMRRHWASLKNPPKTVEEYLVTLEEQGLSRFTQAVRHYAAEL
ncbi:MAG: hypothetical protein ACOYOF_06660 [Verrucomicrobiaceae bacterium]